MKHALVFLLTGLVVTLTIFMIFGTVNPEKFCHAQSSAVVTFPKLTSSMSKVMGSEAVRVVLEEGFGEESSAEMFLSFDELNGGGFAGSLMNFFLPRITLVFPSEIPVITKGLAPFLAIVEVGRPALFAYAIGLRKSLGKGIYSGDYLGHPIFVDQDIAMTLIRNVILAGPEKQLKLAIDAYEGKAASLADLPNYQSGLEDFFDADSDARIVFINSRAFLPKSTGALIDPQKLLNIDEFGIGAARLNITEDGIFVSAKLLSKSGKPLIKLLDTGSREFEISRFIDLDQSFVAGFRSSDLGQAGQMAAEVIVAEDSGGGIGLKRKLLGTILGQFLSHLGPEFIVFTDTQNELHIVAQVRQESKFRDVIEKVSKKFGDNKMAISDVVKSEIDLNNALQFGQFSYEEIKGWIDNLPAKEKEEAMAIFSAIPIASLKSVIPQYEHIEIKGQTIFHHIENGLLFVSTAGGGIERLAKLSAADKVDGNLPFPGGKPVGNAFFVADLTRNFRAVLPKSAGNPTFERLFEIPWLASAQLFDEGTNVRLDANINVPLGPFEYEQKPFSFYFLGMHFLRLLLLLPGLFCLYIFVRRLKVILRGAS
jgi:hypothetical protein